MIADAEFDLDAALSDSEQAALDASLEAPLEEALGEEASAEKAPVVEATADDSAEPAGDAGSDIDDELSLDGMEKPISEGAAPAGEAAAPTEAPAADNKKVELDLEDAPFLEEEDEDEEEEEAAPAGEAPSLEEPETAEAAPWYKRKKILIPVGIVVPLLVIGLYFLLKSDLSSGEEEVAQQEEAAAPETAAEEPEPEVVEFLYDLDPFFVEKVAEDGSIRFLSCKFTAVTDDEALSFEMQQKTTVLRDAVYFYLKNKNLTFLVDKSNVDVLKKDVISVMNQYLSVSLQDMLIEEYLVK